MVTMGITGLVLVDDGECLLVCSKEWAADLRLVVAVARERSFRYRTVADERQKAGFPSLRRRQRRSRNSLRVGILFSL